MRLEESSRRLKIVVTGGSGFIGTNLVADLLQKGHNVFIFDKNTSSKYPNLSILGDVRDRYALSRVLEDVDAVYHLAAEHRDDVSPVSLYYDVNVKGADNLVEAAKENAVQRIIFTSSVAVYGLNAGTPSEKSPLNPFNAYSKSKAESETVFTSWAAEDSDRSLVIVRPVVIFGEHNRGNVFQLLKQIQSRRFVMVGDGKNKKSMGYVQNVSAFLVRCLDLGHGIHFYNYADKPDMSVQGLVTTARRAMGINSSQTYNVPYPIGLLAGYVFDILAKATKRTYSVSSIRIKKFAADTTVSAEKLNHTGFVAPYSLREGLCRMIESEFGSHFKDAKAQKKIC